MSNRNIIQKADLALSDLATNGGLLLPEQADKFILMLIEEPTLLRTARVVSMNSPQRKINKIGFGDRILRPAQSGVALTKEQRAKPNLGQIELNTKEVIAEVRLPYDVIEDNIERGNPFAPAGSSAGGIMDTLLKLMAERASLDLEELALLGDKSKVATDPYLGLLDGWLKVANTVTASAPVGATNIGKDILKQGVLALEPKYLRNRTALRHILSVENETLLRDSIGNRSTALGDAMITGSGTLNLYGSPTMASAMMPSTDLLYTNPLNLLFGIQRQISIEYDKDITTREFIIVLTARVDAQVEEADAVAHITGITQDATP